MLSYVIILALATAVSGFPREPEIDRIVGGTVSDITKRPYQVYLLIQSSHGSGFCGGSILSSTKILTAAHCLPSMEGATIQVRAGSIYREKDGQVATTMEFTMHPQYNTLIIDYDIAIIHIDSDPLRLDGITMKAVSLPSVDAETPDGANLIATGWGDTKEGGQPSEVLLEVTLKKVNYRECKKTYGYITPRFMCAGVPEGGKDACQGDSGGPLVTEDLVQVGIVSGGNGCARPNTPGFYTSVANLRDWIKTTAGV